MQDTDTILVVEDESTDQLLIERALRAIGMKGPIQIVGDGLEAIAYMMGEGKYANREQYAYPSFILTDLKMPRADGFSVLEHLKTNPAWKVIPTAVLTASSDPDDIRTAYLLGANSYHIKPSQFDKLRDLLKVLRDYWQTCQVPEVDLSGRQVHTESKGKLGERYPQPDPGEQKRVGE